MLIIDIIFLGITIIIGISGLQAALGIILLEHTSFGIKERGNILKYIIPFYGIYLMIMIIRK